MIMIIIIVVVVAVVVVVAAAVVVVVVVGVLGFETYKLAKTRSSPVQQTPCNDTKTDFVASKSQQQPTTMRSKTTANRAKLGKDTWLLSIVNCFTPN